MPLITFIAIIAIIGFLLWMVNNYIPMDGKIRNILNAVVVIGVVVWILQTLGIMGPLSAIHIGK